MPKLTISALLPMPLPYPPLPRFLYNRELVESLVGETRHEHYVLNVDEVSRDWGKPVIPRVLKRKPKHAEAPPVVQKELGDNHPPTARHYLGKSERLLQHVMLINDTVEGWLGTKSKPSEELIW